MNNSKIPIKDIPVEFFKVIEKKNSLGWNSLSVKEAGLYYKYKNEYIRQNENISQ